MTTTVIVKTHSWPVEVTSNYTYEGVPTAPTVERIEPNSSREVYIHSHLSIEVRELPLPDPSDIYRGA